MSLQKKHVKLYEGSSIILNGLKYRLEEKNISCIIKNNSESGRLAGFSAGLDNNEIFVFEEDLNAAEIILQEYLLKKD